MINKQFNRIIGLCLIAGFISSSTIEASHFGYSKLNSQVQYELVTYESNISLFKDKSEYIFKFREYKSEQEIPAVMIFRKQRMSYERLYELVENILTDIPELVPTDDFIKLVVETIIAESDGGWYFNTKHLGGLGIAQVNYKTAQYLRETLKKRKEEIYEVIESYRKEDMTLKENLIHNVNYNIAMCAIQYYHRRGDRIYNEIDTLSKRARVWKKFYNTEAGVGTPELYKQRVTTY